MCSALNLGGQVVEVRQVVVVVVVLPYLLAVLDRVPPRLLLVQGTVAVVAGDGRGKVGLVIVRFVAHDLFRHDSEIWRNIIVLHE